MKIAVSATGKALDAAVDPRFGRADYFILVDSESRDIVKVVDNAEAQNAAHGAGINSASVVADTGAQVVLTGMIGPKAFEVLQAAGIKVITDMSGTVREAVERYIKGDISSSQGPSAEMHSGQNFDMSRGGMGMGRGIGGGGRGMGGGRGAGMGGASGKGRGMGRGRRG